MTGIFKSTSKFIFWAIGMTACAAFLLGVWRGDVALGTDHFMALAGAAFGYYFSRESRKDGDANQIKVAELDE
jgi:hypothetical protein